MTASIDDLPTVAAAQRVADAFAVDSNVMQVLLYGSVARGQQESWSDIDLLVIHRDLDYSQQQQVAMELDKAGRAIVADYAVHVYAIDLPTWRRRTQMRSSFETGVMAQPHITLHARPFNDSDINWDDQQVGTADELANAVGYLRDRLTPRFVNLSVHLSVSDLTLGHPLDTEYRQVRALSAVTDAAEMIEMAFGSLLTLLAGRPTEDGHALVVEHYIDSCLRILSDPHRTAFSDCFQVLGLDARNLRCWRSFPYPDADCYKASGQPFDVGCDVDSTVLAALVVTDIVIDEFEQEASAHTEKVDAARKGWCFVKGLYETVDPRTGLQRDTPLDLTALFEGSGPQKLGAVADRLSDALSSALSGAETVASGRVSRRRGNRKRSRVARR